MIRISVAASVAGVIGACAMSAAVPAYADNPASADSRLLSSLDMAGIEYPDVQGVFAAARAVCDYLQDGHPLNATVRGVKNANPELSLTHAAKFVAITRDVYCSAPPLQPGGEIS